MSEQEGVRGKLWCVIIAVIIVVIIVWVWCWWWKCPFCPDCPDPDCSECDTCEQSMVLEDTHGGIWMVMDNGFVHDLGIEDHDICASSDDPADYLGDCVDNGYEVHGESHSDTKFRHGVLLQLGEIIGDGTKDVVFSQVVLTLDDGSKKTLGGGISGNEPFDWLDINPVGELCALDAFHAYSLFDSPLVEQECDGAGLDPATLPQSCLRERALHASFDPTIGVITYWSGDNYYEVEAHEDVLETGHVGFTFCFNDPITVDRWNEGCFQERYTGVVEVLVDLKDPDANHSIFHDDPMDGGLISKP